MNGAHKDGAVLATAVIGWTEAWQVDVEAFERQITGLLDHGLTDLYLFGTAGEGYAVCDEQFGAVTRRFATRLIDAGLDPMVGIISLSVPTTIQRVNTARRAGVHRFQLSMPSWGTLDADETTVFFEDVLGSFRDCEFLHYNTVRSGRVLTGPEYARLCARHPNLVATKQSTGDMGNIRSLMEDAPQVRHYFTEQGYAYARLLGDCGLLASVSLSNPEQAHRYTTCDADERLAREAELHRMAVVLKDVAGGDRLIDGAYDKVLWKLHDPSFPLRMCPPHASARDDASSRYADWLTAQVPRWAPPERRSRRLPA